jgi:hypothetical protein
LHLTKKCDHATKEECYDLHYYCGGDSDRGRGSIVFKAKRSPATKKDDREKFSSTVEHFNILEEMALDAMRLRDTTTKEKFFVEFEGNGACRLGGMCERFRLSRKTDLPPHIENYRMHLIEYSNHRLQQTLLLIKSSEEQTEKYRGSIDSVQKKINEVKEVIKKEKPSFD